MNTKKKSLHMKGEWDVNVKQLSLMGSSIGYAEQDNHCNTLMHKDGINVRSSIKRQ